MDPSQRQTKFQIRRPSKTPILDGTGGVDGLGQPNQVPKQIPHFSNTIHEAPETIPEPHMGSFIKAENIDASLTAGASAENVHGLNSGNVDELEFEELDSEEKKDYTLSISFTLIAALVLISAVGFYVKNYVQPSRTSIDSDLLIDSSKIDQTKQDTLSQLRVASDDSFYGNQSVGTSTIESSSVGISASSSHLGADTFAKSTTGISNSSTTNKVVITEYVIRATSTMSSTSTLRTQVLSEATTSKQLGISFMKDPFWTQTTKGDSVLLKKVGPEAKDTIYITRFRGTSVTTSDTANGNVTYFYNTNEKVWMQLEYSGDISSLGDKIIPNVVVPTRSTKDNKPIFDGTSRSKTLIIALSTDDFIIVNINGTGYTKILDTFVEGIRAIK